MPTENPLSGNGNIDEEVKRVVSQLGTMAVGSPEYETAVKQLETLCRARNYKSSSAISADTIVLAAANILGILLILNYEKAGVVTSKALGFILRGGRA